MFKQAGKFFNRLKGGHRRGCFTTDMVSTASLTTIVPHRYPAPKISPMGPTVGSRLYLVRFVSKADPDETFLKVGISSMAVNARFQGDFALYNVETIALSAIFRGADALIIEKSLHRAFRAFSFRPRVPLKSGNTECYECTERNALRFAEIVNAI